MEDKEDIIQVVTATMEAREDTTLTVMATKEDKAATTYVRQGGLAPCWGYKNSLKDKICT